ncbi:hypothetical protein RhiirA5_431971 [Rhizophagus irregularis]|uniref:Uncharacterized protein n=1 Tax=Rhizophagus irregularis TaxID=588596 RepID=A0A2N0NU61_9GLOM|nr:hypothetical protein RhiirA5_431971 [Rhizophagus irregularis]CAB5191711.1 unnamed protein product [Rhizophagus irregularis]
MKKGKRKPRKPCWDHFSVNKDDPHPQNPHVTCNYCSKEYKRGIPERMQAHLDNCDEAPEEAKAQFNNDSMSETEQNSLEILLVKTLTSAGVDSSFVENPSTIRFFQKLRPSFKLPNRRKVELITRYQQETDNYSDAQTRSNRIRTKQNDDPNNQQKTESNPNYQIHTQQNDNPNNQQETESNPNCQIHTQQNDNPNNQQETESNPNYQIHTQQNDYPNNQQETEYSNEAANYQIHTEYSNEAANYQIHTDYPNYQPDSTYLFDPMLFCPERSDTQYENL